MTNNGICEACLAALPWYIAGSLPSPEQKRLHLHLEDCASCQRALLQWRSIAVATQETGRQVHTSRPFSQAWFDLSALLAEDAQQANLVPAAGRQRSLMDRFLQRVNTVQRSIACFWIVLIRQATIIHKSVWTVTALVMITGSVFFLLSPYLFGRTSSSFFSWLLTLVTLAASAIGAACIYGGENDSALEIALATPTSIRLLLLGRLVLVIGYNSTLALLASAALTLTNGGGLWGIVQLWFSPLLFFAAISLVLSMLTGSLCAIQAVLLFETVQMVAISIERNMRALPFVRLLPLLQLLDFSTWHAQRAIWLLAALCFAFALLYAPHQSRLAQRT